MEGRHNHEASQPRGTKKEKNTFSQTSHLKKTVKRQLHYQYEQFLLLLCCCSLRNAERIICD
jgi:hypothetical protein